MKPLKLTMQAFLSYKGKETIDFSAFEGSLFLVDGETGAGKTSIFDAMMYALYGVSSGGLRSAEELRSHYAAKEDETFVSFSFLVHGKTYTIERKPLQMVPGKRKKDLVRQNSWVNLSGVDLPHPLTKAGEVERKIKELLGLDAGQFLMTTMIPQGKFMELITADTKTRQSLLRDILGTDILSRFADNLRAKAKELSDKVKATEDKIDILCEQYETDNPEHLKAIRAEATPTGTVYPHDKLKEVGQVLSRDIADRQIKRDALFNAKKAADAAAKKARDDFSAHQLEDEKRKAYLENKAKLDALLPHEAEMKAKKEANDRYEKAGLVLLSLEQEAKSKRDFSAADAKLKESQAKEPETEKRLQKALESSKKIALLEEEKASLIAEGEKTGTALSKVKAIPSKEKEATEAAISLEKVAEKVAAQEKAMADKRKEAKDLRAKHEKSTAEADLAAAEKDIEALDQAAKTLKGFRGDFAAYREALASEKEAQEAYEAAKAKYLAADHRYSEIFVAYLDGQAGILAGRLVEGAPCPVCGSTSHPHPAALSSKVDESAFKEAEAERETKSASMSETASTANAKAARREELGKSLLARVKDAFGGEPELSSLDSTLNEEEAKLAMKKENLQKNVDKYRAKVSEKEMDIKLAAKAEQEALTLEAELPALQAAVSKAQEAKAKAESLLNSLKQETDGLDEKALETRKGEIESRKAKIEEEATALRTELSAAQAEKASLATEIVQAEASLKKASTDLETAFEAYRKSLLDNGFTDVEEAKNLRTRSATEVAASKKEVDDYFASLTGARSLDEDQRSKGYDKLPERNLASEEETCKDLEHDASNKTDEAASYDAKLKQDKNVLNQIKALIEGSSDDIRKAAEASALSEVARGTMAGTLRVDFETFYQSQIFSEIVDRASIRFSEMSGGFFRLVAHNFWEEAGKALDIDVIDENTNRVRPVGTLSGGEAFQAALSLALSLSDVITSEAGGSEIDCLFIDEGFGNLDSHNLDSVIRTIREISSSGNKMVGIISHVESLASEVDKKIEVKKGPSGSHLKVVA